MHARPKRPVCTLFLWDCSHYNSISWAPVTSITSNDACTVCYYQNCNCLVKLLVFVSILKFPSPCFSVLSQASDDFACSPDFTNFTRYIAHNMSVRVDWSTWQTKVHNGSNNRIFVLAPVLVGNLGQCISSPPHDNSETQASSISWNSTAIFLVPNLHPAWGKRKQKEENAWDVFTGQWYPFWKLATLHRSNSRSTSWFF